MSSTSHSNESLVPDTQCGYTWIFDIYLKMSWTHIPPSHRPNEGGQVLPMMENTQTIRKARHNNNTFVNDVKKRREVTGDCGKKSVLVFPHFFLTSTGFRDCFTSPIWLNRGFVSFPCCHGSLCPVILFFTH